jgi:type VI secretion system secreted protein VgrG
VGSIDSTIVGGTHVVTISPPGEMLASGDGGALTSVLMENGKIVLDTGSGATITMEGSEIRIAAQKFTVTADELIHMSSKNTTTIGADSVAVLTSKLTTVVTSSGTSLVSALKGVTVASGEGDTIITGNFVKIN